MKSRLITAIIVLASCFQNQAFGADSIPNKSKSQIYIDSLLTTEPFKSSLAGILAVKVSGDTVAEAGSLNKLVPASNMKLITTGLALNELGADFRFGTMLGYTGSIANGVLKGDLYIIGGGDPTIGSKDSIAKNTEKLFEEWKNFVSKAGIRRIEGTVIGDGRYFEGPIEEESWLYEDIGTYYGTGSNGLCFFRNIQNFNIIPGNAAGDRLSVSPSYPEAPWMKFSYNCTTGEKGTGDKLYLFGTDLYPAAEMRGTFGIDRKSKTVMCSNKFGAYTCAYYFMKYLNINNIAAAGGCADIDSKGRIRKKPGLSDSGRPATAQDKISILGRTVSPELRRIAYITNQRSDNFYAEAMFRMIGKKSSGSAEYGLFDQSIDNAIKKLGIDNTGYRIVDGSGLSKKDYVSPGFFCSFLRAMMETDVFEPYLNTLTQPDKGSQAGRLRNSPDSIKSRIYWKSGSMDGVRCYSGYIIPSDGVKDNTIIFSVMLNNCTAPNWKINIALDGIIATLAGEN